MHISGHSNILQPWRIYWELSAFNLLTVTDFRTSESRNKKNLKMQKPTANAQLFYLKIKPICPKQLLEYSGKASVLQNIIYITIFPFTPACKIQHSQEAE